MGKQGKCCHCLPWLPKLSSLILTRTFFKNSITTLIWILVGLRYNVQEWVETLPIWHTKSKKMPAVMLKWKSTSNVTLLKTQLALSLQTKSKLLSRTPLHFSIYFPPYSQILIVHFPPQQPCSFAWKILSIPLGLVKSYSSFQKLLGLLSSGKTSSTPTSCGFSEGPGLI